MRQQLQSHSVRHKSPPAEQYLVDNTEHDGSLTGQASIGGAHTFTSKYPSSKYHPQPQPQVQVEAYTPQTRSTLRRSKTVAYQAEFAASQPVLQTQSNNPKVSQPQPQSLSRNHAIRRPNPKQENTKANIQAGDYSTYRPYLRSLEIPTNCEMESSEKQQHRKCTITGPSNLQRTRPDLEYRPFSFNKGPDIVESLDSKVTEVSALDVDVVPEAPPSKTQGQLSRPKPPTTTDERGKFTTHTSILITSCDLKKPGKNHLHLPLSRTGDTHTTAILLNNRLREIAQLLDQIQDSRYYTNQSNTFPTVLIHKTQTAKVTFRSMLRQLQVPNNHNDSVSSGVPTSTKKSHDTMGQIEEWKEAVQIVLQVISRVLRESLGKEEDEMVLTKVAEFVRDAEQCVSDFSAAM